MVYLGSRFSVTHHRRFRIRANNKHLGKKIARRKALARAAAAGILAVILVGAVATYYSIVLSPSNQSSSTTSSTTTGTTQSLVDAAKKEGAVKLYYATSVAFMQPLINRFQQLYPFLKVDGTSTFNLVDRVEAENRAGTLNVDLVYLVPEQIEVLTQDGLIAPYQSPQAQAFDPKFVGTNNMWLDVYAIRQGIAYNSKLSQDLVPKDWTDFINPNPQWRGRILLTDPRLGSINYDGFAGLVSQFGLNTTLNIVRGLKSAGAQSVSSSVTALQQVASGEFDITLFMPFNLWGRTYGNASAPPVTYVQPKSGEVGIMNGMATMANSPHPNAAKLLYDFLASQEAAQIMTNGWMPVTRSGVQPLQQIPPSPNLIFFNQFKAATVQASFNSQFESIWGK